MKMKSLVFRPEMKMVRKIGLIYFQKGMKVKDLAAIFKKNWWWHKCLAVSSCDSTYVKSHSSSMSRVFDLFPLEEIRKGKYAQETF